MKHTWDNIASIHGILILYETETIHELDLGNLAGTMFAEVSLDFWLGDLEGVSAAVQKKEAMAWTREDHVKSRDGRGRKMLAVRGTAKVGIIDQKTKDQLVRLR